TASADLPRAGRSRAGADRGLSSVDGPALPARLRQHPRIRRHRHPSVRVSRRRGASARLAQPAADRTAVGRQAVGAGHGRRGRAGRDCGAHRGHRRVLVVAVAAHPASRVGRALGSGPLRWVGVRSYGIYLWHLPVIVLTGAAIDTGRVDLPRAGLQLAATIGLAALSWKYVEQPIRHGALGRLWRHRPRLAVVRGWAWTVPTAAIAVLATACVGLADAPSPSSRAEPASTSTGITITAPKTSPTVATPSRHPSANASRPSAVPVTTSCTTVTHMGDSTSDGLVDPNYLPNPADRIDAQYRRVGATTEHIAITGGTSILETVEPGEANIYQTASGLVSHGVRGCWVLALGTNDTADVF